MADVTVKPITSILVANRGEIARRIMRTARDMGIQTVAVYADGDQDAPFVKEADAAFALNGRTSAESYLVIEKIIDTCKRSGADAVHPGYGFLSENAEFAKAVIDAGFTWIGPSTGKSGVGREAPHPASGVGMGGATAGERGSRSSGWDASSACPPRFRGSWGPRRPGVLRPPGPSVHDA